MEPPKVPVLQMFLSACQLYVRTTQCYLLLELITIFSSLLQRKPRLCCNPPEFPSQGKGETFASVACFLSRGKRSASLSVNNRVGQRVTSFCFVSRLYYLTNFISSHGSSAPLFSPLMSALALLMPVWQFSRSLMNLSDEAEPRSCTLC